MNLAKFAILSKRSKNNPVFGLIKRFKKHSFFKGSSFDVYSPTLDPQHLIVVLGQSHPVLRGNINNRQLEQIVACQSKLVLFYSYFHKEHGVHTFGGEGLHGGFEDMFSASGGVTPLFLEAFKKFYKDKDRYNIVDSEMFAVAHKIMEYFGNLWRKALRDKRDRDVVKYASAINGQALYDFLTPATTLVYPVEGEKQYKHVLENVEKLEKEMRNIENDYDYRLAQAKLKRTKKMKDFTEKEIDLLKKRNESVKRFNDVLGSDFRERATLELMREKARVDKLVVFTMGVAHRRNYLRLVNEYLSDTETAFVFVKAPELRPKYLWQVAFLAGLLLVFWLVWWWIG